MKIPMNQQSTCELAAQTSMKLTAIRREYVSSLLGRVYVCRLDGKLMRITDARRIIESRVLENERKQGRPSVQ